MTRFVGTTSHTIKVRQSLIRAFIFDLGGTKFDGVTTLYVKFAAHL